MNYELSCTMNDYMVAFNLYQGTLRPVDKFLNKDELYRVLNEYTYKNECYSLPYLLFVDRHYDRGDRLRFSLNRSFAFEIRVEDTYEIDRTQVSQLMYGTSDALHPGVAQLVGSTGIAVSGKLTFFNRLIDIPHSSLNQPCAYVFQSRNPPHRAHEQIISEYAPNLVYSTPFTTANQNDYSFSTKMRAQELMRDKYGVSLLVTSLPRVFAGPREALQNCLLFQNLGAQYFIMGRGKNCVGDFYGEDQPYVFCKKFKDEGRITIEPVWYDTVYASGVEIRASSIKKQYIDRLIAPPEDLMSSYISKILLEDKCLEC